MESHIPNALNLPVLDDEEYKQIGTLYKQNSIEANFLGASIACKNIANILKTNRDLLNHRHKILVYCARGGNRSLSLCSVLLALKLRVERLNGGYKAYRNMVVHALNTKMDRIFLTLCGDTGCGKSELIQMAQSWSIDLESLCNHFGSSFGFMARGSISANTPSIKMFQNMLFYHLTSKEGVLLIENESKKLGDIIIPKPLYDAYQDSKKILIECDLEHRVRRILNLYSDIKYRDFIDTMDKISPYMRKETKNEIISAFENGDKYRVAELLLVKYYDVKYKKVKCDFVVNSNDINKAYEEILGIRASIK